MSTTVTVTLPDGVYRQAAQLARLTNLKVTQVLSEAIELSLLPAGFRQPDFKPIEKLSNREVLRLTRLQMTQAEDRRLSRLLYCQQAGKLGHQERVELLALMQAYGVGLMRKAQALKEGVRRGLLPPIVS